MAATNESFPADGAPCRRIGESAATIDMLDDSAALVGCPTREEANKLSGQFLKTVERKRPYKLKNTRDFGGLSSQIRTLANRGMER